MKSVLLAIIALIVAVVAGQFIAGDPGFVVLGWENKVVRTSLVFFVLLVFACMFIGYFAIRALVRLMSMRNRLQQWRLERRRLRSQKALEKGYLALAKGDWQRAERLFSRGADPDAAAPIHYLGAAEAAHAMQEPARRDTYLMLAHDALPEADVAVGLKQAEMLLDEEQYEQALVVLQRLREREPGNREVIRLLRALYVATGDWEAIVDDLIPALRQSHAGSKQEIMQLQRRAYCALLERADTAQIETLWQQLPRSERSQTNLIAAYAAALNRVGEAERAEELLRKTLRHSWDATLVTLYGLLDLNDLDKQIGFAESLLKSHPDDTSLLLALGRLNRRQELWGAACTHLQKLIEQQPSAEGYRLLAETLEAMDRGEEAAACFRQGLELATSY